MRVRRVVTGHDREGRPTIVADGPIPRQHEYAEIPGMVEALGWATDHPHVVPDDGADPTAMVSSYLPSAGSTRLLILTLPPDTVFMADSFDGAAAAAEQSVASPGLADTFDPKSPGMHKTPTVDYGFVLDGEIWLDLGNNSPTQLGRGDLVIQNGTRHAWRNKGSETATIAFVLVGA